MRLPAFSFQFCVPLPFEAWFSWTGTVRGRWRPQTEHIARGIKNNGNNIAYAIYRTVSGDMLLRKRPHWAKLFMWEVREKFNKGSSLISLRGRRKPNRKKKKRWCSHISLDWGILQIYSFVSGPLNFILCCHYLNESSSTMIDRATRVYSWRTYVSTFRTFPSLRLRRHLPFLNSAKWNWVAHIKFDVFIFFWWIRAM